MFRSSFAGNSLLLDPAPFSPEITFSCGQSFRFFKVSREGKEGWEGIVEKKFVRIEREGTALRLSGIHREDIPFWTNFFALDWEEEKIRQDIFAHSKKDLSWMKRAWENGRGIRLLRQDAEEALFTFILSQNNNIPRITHLVSSLCEAFGDRIKTPYGEGFAFPEHDVLARTSEEAIRETRCGFRAKYISGTARMLQSGAISLSEIAALPTSLAAQKLMELPGVGEKVAACTLLFGFARYDAFPVDTWMKKVIERRFAARTPDFGQYRGIAQQYLFYYERTLGGKDE